MRAMLVLVIAVALGWCLYWSVGKIGAETAANMWMEERRAEGWQAEATTVKTSGFPYRFDTTFNDLALADPETGWSWRAPEFQLLALSYQPTHLIAIWPPKQKVATPLEDIAIASAEMRASAVFAANSQLALKRSNLVINEMRLTSSAGWSSTLASGLLATRLVDGQDKTYDIGFDAKSLTPSAPLKNWLDPTRQLPDAIEALKIDATFGFDRPWNRAALEAQRPQITSIDLRDVRATWGNLDLRIAGEMTVDATGIPSGDITIKATNWREMLDLAESSGALATNFRTIAESMLEGLAGLSGNSQTLDVPLKLSSGRVLFSGIPIAVAPNLTLR